MFEDKSKINYPYEFTETTTVPLKNPIDKKFKNGTGTHNFPITKHYKEKFYILKKLIIIKINNRIDPYNIINQIRINIWPCIVMFLAMCKSLLCNSRTF